MKTNITALYKLHVSSVGKSFGDTRRCQPRSSDSKPVRKCQAEWLFSNSVTQMAYGRIARVWGTTPLKGIYRKWLLFVFHLQETNLSWLVRLRLVKAAKAIFRPFRLFWLFVDGPFTIFTSTVIKGLSKSIQSGHGTTTWWCLNIQLPLLIGSERRNASVALGPQQGVHGRPQEVTDPQSHHWWRLQDFRKA